MQRILVIGSNGYIGGAVCAEAKKRHIAFEPYPSGRFPFWGKETSWPHWQKMLPDAVIIAADFEKRVAPYHVMKDFEPDKGLDELRERFGRLLLLLRSSRHRVIIPSIDKVFDGERGPYTEDREVNPLTPNAQARRAMEEVALRRFGVSVVRTSVVYGDGPTKKDRRREEILARLGSGQEVQAPVNVFRSPVSVQEVASSLIHLAMIETEIPPIIHLAASRRSIFQMIRECIVPEQANNVLLKQVTSEHPEDTSLETNYPSLLKK